MEARKYLTPRRLKTERSKKHDALRRPKTTAEDHVVERVSERFEEQVVEMPVPRLIEGVFEIREDHAPGAHFEAVCGAHRLRCARATDLRRSRRGCRRSHTAVVEAVVEVIRVIPEHTVAPRAGVLVRRNLENIVDVPMPQVVEDGHHGTNR